MTKSNQKKKLFNALPLVNAYTADSASWMSTLSFARLPAFLPGPSPRLPTDQCDQALGMESGEIADSQLTVSSSFSDHIVGAHSARIRTEHRGGADGGVQAGGDAVLAGRTLAAEHPPRDTEQTHITYSSRRRYTRC